MLHLLLSNKAASMCPHYHYLSNMMINYHQADTRDMETATVLSMQYIKESRSLLQGPQARQALLDWLHLLHEAHPTSRHDGHGWG